MSTEQQENLYYSLGQSNFRHDRSMSREEIEGQFGEVYLKNFHTRKAGLDAAMSEINSTINLEIEVPIGERPIGQCVSASLITAVGSEEILPTDLRELGIIRNGSMLHGETIDKVLNEKDLLRISVNSAHDFRCLMEDARSRGALVLSHQGKHLTGVRPVLMEKKDGSAIKRNYCVVDTSRPVDKGFIISAEQLSDIYSQADIVDGERKVMVLAEQPLTDL